MLIIVIIDYVQTQLFFLTFKFYVQDFVYVHHLYSYFNNFNISSMHSPDLFDKKESITF